METEQILIENDDMYGLRELEKYSRGHACREDEPLPISMYRGRAGAKRSKSRPGSFERWVDDVIFSDKSLEDPLI